MCNNKQKKVQKAKCQFESGAPSTKQNTLRGGGHKPPPFLNQSSTNMKKQILTAHLGRSIKLAKDHLDAFEANSTTQTILLYLLRLQVRACNRAIARGIPITDLPTISTNNVAIAKGTRVSARTVQRHRKKLEKYGCLAPLAVEGGKPKYSITHGNYRDFEIKTEPHLIYFHYRQHPQNRVFTGLETLGGVDILSPTSSSNSKNELKQELEHDTLTPRDRNVSTGVDNRELKRTNEELGKENDEAATTQRRRKLSGEAIKCLRHERLKLYPNLHISMKHRESLIVIFESLFADAPTQLLPRISANYMKRISLVAAHWEGELPAPEVFFDPARKDYFRLTKDWPKQPKKYPPPPRRQVATANGFKNLREAIGV